MGIVWTLISCFVGDNGDSLDTDVMFVGDSLDTDVMFVGDNGDSLDTDVMFVGDNGDSLDTDVMFVGDNGDSLDTDVMFVGDNGDSLENPEKDNRNLVDGSGNQKLSRDDIEAMKKGGVGGHVRVVV